MGTAAWNGQTPDIEQHQEDWQTHSLYNLDDALRTVSPAWLPVERAPPALPTR